MKKNILKVGLLMIISLFCFNVEAKEANLNTYNFATEEVNVTTERIINMTTIQFSQPSSVYEFFDEDNLFNLVYTSEEHVYWQKFDKDMNPIKLVTMDMYFDKSSVTNGYEELVRNFGNALYYKEHLYVVYGRQSTATTAEEVGEDKPMAVIKYDKDGNIVDSLEMVQAFLNPTTDYTFSTYLPFFPNQNCSMAVNSDGIIGVFYGRHMYNNHDSSMTFYVDAETLDWVSHHYYASEENIEKFNNLWDYYQSHSMGERIIATSDGGYLMIDSNDASTRGLNVTKIIKDENGIYQRKTLKMIHYREGAKGTYGYNNTYHLMGNVIELSDGYLYVGALERTLDRYFGYNINESWDIFVQKYSKDMFNMTEKEAQLFDTPIRSVTGVSPTEDESTLGRLYLTGDEVDYGIKYLTDYQNEYSVLQIRAVELEDDKVAILYELVPIDPVNTGGYLLDDLNSKFYYMVIDGDGEILIEPIELKGVKLTLEEILPYNDGKIYWTTTNGKSYTVNVLDPLNPIEPITINKTNLSLVVGSSEKLEAKYNLNDTVTYQWSSSDSTVASVDQNGNVTGLKEGSATITFKTSNGYSITCNVIVNKYLKGDMNQNGKIEVADALEILYIVIGKKTATDTKMAIGDMNNNGKIEAIDAIEILRIYMKQ